MARLDGYTLSIAAPPAHPTIDIGYSATSLSRSSSASSAPSNSLKRKRSDGSMTVTITASRATPVPEAPLVLPIIFPSVNRSTNDAYVSPPSPAPTEIIEDPYKCSEVCMEEAKAVGVKVRDFAHEPLPKGRDIRAPELWTTPLEALVMHDRYIRVAAHRAANFRPSGRVLHRLLALNWVTQEEAEFHWRDEDWKAVNEYANRPLGAYPFCIPAGVKKPTAAYRAALRRDKYVPFQDDIPEEKIFVPEDEPGMDDGPARVDPAFLREAVATLRRSLSCVSSGLHFGAPSYSPPGPSDADPVHVDKKRRVSGESPSVEAAATPENSPPTTPSRCPGQSTPRSASSAASSSRSSTPPVQSTAPRLARGGLARTETLSRIV
ncbi:hypothetical protein BV20DRAFT_970919 [Pilatotrama ljubarskyi]|nr:hypothetical protein BV20DRAFT_970919 [Pilatotrama ljubarskyi]